MLNVADNLQPEELYEVRCWMPALRRSGSGL